MHYKIIKNHGILFPGKYKCKEITSASPLWPRGPACVGGCLMGQGGAAGVGAGFGGMVGGGREMKPFTSKGRLVEQVGALWGRCRDSCWAGTHMCQGNKWGGLEDQKKTWKSQVTPNLYLSTRITMSGIWKGAPDLYKVKSHRLWWVCNGSDSASFLIAKYTTHSSPRHSGSSWSPLKFVEETCIPQASTGSFEVSPGAKTAFPEGLI